MESNNVKRVIADGAYDSNENFRFLCQNDIEPAIRVKRTRHYQQEEEEEEEEEEEKDAGHIVKEKKLY